MLETYVSDTYKVNPFQKGERLKGVKMKHLGGLQLVIVDRLEFTYILYILYVTEGEMMDLSWFRTVTVLSVDIKTVNFQSKSVKSQNNCKSYSSDQITCQVSFLSSLYVTHSMHYNQ